MARPRFSLIGVAGVAAIAAFVGATNERDPDAIPSGVANVVEPAAAIGGGAGDLLKVGVSELGEAGAVAGGAVSGAGNGAAASTGGGNIRVVPAETGK